MPSTNEGVLLLIGALFFIIGLVGGGFEISAIKVPTINKYSRIASAAVGALFMSISIFRLIAPPDIGTGGTSSPVATSVASSNSPVPTLTTAPPTVAPTDMPTPTTAPSATPTNQEYLTVAKSWPQAFMDTFDDDTGKWRYINSNANPSVTVSYDGRYSLLVDAQNNSVREAFYREAGPPIPDVFYLSVEADANLQTGCEYGIIAGNFGQERYEFSIVGDKKQYRITRVLKSGDKETRTDLIPATDLPADVRTPNILRIIAQANRYLLYINDIYVDEIADSRIDVNRIGTGIFVCKGRTATLVFDNFELRLPTQ